MSNNFVIDDVSKKYRFSFEEVFDDSSNNTLDGDIKDEIEEEIYTLLLENFICSVLDKFKEDVKNEKTKYKEIFKNQYSLISKNIDYLLEIEETEQRNIEINKLLDNL
jgi:hypothetical protein